AECFQFGRGGRIFGICVASRGWAARETQDRDFASTRRQRDRGFRSIATIAPLPSLRELDDVQACQLLGGNRVRRNRLTGEITAESTMHEGAARMPGDVRTEIE